MSNHTPGPWAENACEIQAQDGSPICEMLAWPEDSGVNYPYSPVADANARLIAAAPELLAEMRSALATAQDGLENVESGDEEGVRMALEAIRSGLEAAVAKAIKEEA